MPDIIITPSSGKLEFVDTSAQSTRRHSFTMDANDGLNLDAHLSAAAISAPLNVINVTVNNSNANYPFVLAQSGETGAKNLLMDGAGGTYNPFTNTATIDISGNSATTTLASNSTNLGGVAAASYVTLTGTQTLTNKTITGTFTGNLTGTGSWATNAVNANTATNSTQLNGQSDSYYTNIPARLGYTPVNKAGDTISGNLTVNGNFAVNGSVTAFSASNIYITSSTLTVTDNILLMNALSPYQRYAGIQMYDSGSGTLSQFLWDGEGDYFFLTGSSVNGKIITGPDGQNNLTANYIPKATAGYKLGNSLIYDDGTNVAIGTTSPAQKLDVVGNIRCVPASSAWAEGLSFSMPTTSSWGGLRWRRERANADGNHYIGYIGTDTTDDLVFGSNNAGTQIDNNIRITKAGLVGVGTSSPVTKFHVVGVISGSSFSGAGTGLTGTAASLTAGTANSVAWTNVSSRPTAVSAFTNDSLYQYHRGDITSLSSSATNVVQPLGTFDGANITNAPTSGWYNYLSSTHGSYLTSLIANLHRSADWYVGYKEGPGGTPTNPSWYKLLHSGNYTDYTVTKTGTGASGTWAITSSWATNAVTALNVGNGTITIAAGTGVGVGTTNTFTTNQSGATTVTITNTGVTSLTTNTGLSSNVSATGAVTVTNTGVTAITTNTGLSTNASATGAVTITNTGVTSNVAGTGISVSGATGAVTITNSGVTSAVAGTGVSVSGATGAITFSIGQAVGTGNSPTFAAVTTSTDGANHIMAGTTNAEGIRMTPASSTTYPVFLRSINPGVGEASPWIYKEQATDWGIWHNNPVNSIDFTKQGSVGISTNVGGSSTNAVTVRVEMATGFVQTIAGYRNSAGTTILDNNGNITGNAATATILQTARNIGGVSFNGSADINLPGVNTAGNQNTSGNAATATTATNANAVSFTEVELNAPVTVSGTWTSGNGSEWGEPKFGTSFNQFRYTDGNGPYVEYNIPANHHACFISQLQWDTGGYADCHGVQSDGDLVFLRRINTRQLVENSNHGNTIQHDGATVSFVGSGLQAFTKIRITNRSGRIHMTGIAFTRQIDDGYEGTGMVHPAQISHQGSGSGLDADLLDGYNSATANTVNTIVLRDASGNFSAGTITATLSGTATTANALNTSNSYTGVNFLATGFLQSNSGNIKSDTPFALLTTSNGAQALSTRGILLGTSYDTTPGANEIRTTNNTSLYLNARGTGDIQFQTADSLKMMLLNNGNVGIGTSNPGRKLDVEGIVRTRGASGTGGFEIGAASSGAAKWRIEWDSASDSLDFNWVG
jgi:hypothetical protein